MQEIKFPKSTPKSAIRRKRRQMARENTGPNRRYARVIDKNVNEDGSVTLTERTEV